MSCPVSRTLPTTLTEMRTNSSVCFGTAHSVALLKRKVLNMQEYAITYVLPRKSVMVFLMP